MLHMLLGENHSRDKWTPLFGRILLALLFVPAGITKLFDVTGSAVFAATVFGDSLATLAVIVAIVVELGAGLMLVFGFRTKIAALVLIVFTGLVTFSFHAFWAVPPEAQQLQMLLFFKNVAVVGGLLYVFAYGAGTLSMDAKNRNT